MLDVAAFEHAVQADVAVEGELLTVVFADRTVGAADKQVGLDADLAELGDGLLRGLRLELAGGLDEGHQRAVQEGHVLAAGVVLELAERLEERQAFDVAGGAADLGDEHVDAFAALEDAVLDLVGDVRDDLHGLAEVVAAAFLLDDGLVDLAGAEAVEAREFARGEAFVVAEVEVGLGAVVQDVDLAVLIGAHGARIDVEVWIELLDAHLQAPALEQGPQGGGGEAFAEGGDDAAGDENILHGKEVGRAGERVKKIRPAGPVTEAGLDFRIAWPKKTMASGFSGRSGGRAPA